ncbi:hypothetical protein ES703_105657 [subsurface metagenome]
MKATPNQTVLRPLFKTDYKLGILRGERLTKQGGWNLVIANDASYLLHQVNRLTYIAPPVRSSNPNLISGSGGLTLKTQRIKRAYYLLKTELNAQHAFYFLCREQNGLVLFLTGININYTPGCLATTQFSYELGCPPDSQWCQFLTDTPLKSVARFGSKPQCPAGKMYAGRIEISRFQQYYRGIVSHLTVFTTHNSSQSHRPLAIGNDQHIARKQPFHAIQCGETLTLTRPAHNYLLTPYQTVIKSMQGLTVLQHHVVGNINDVIYGALSASQQPLLQPRR